MLRLLAPEASSFFGTGAVAVINSSSRLGYAVLVSAVYVNVVLETYRDGQVVAASQLCDLPSVSERSTHDDGLVVVLLVVVIDGLDRCHSWVLLLGVGLSSLGLVPIQDTANEW